MPRSFVSEVATLHGRRGGTPEWGEGAAPRGGHGGRYAVHQLRFDPSDPGLRTRGARLRRVRSRPRRIDDRPGTRLARLRRGTGREAREDGRPHHLDDPRQGTLHRDRMEEPGPVREIDPDPKSRAALPAPEVATKD